MNHLLTEGLPRPVKRKTGPGRPSVGPGGMVRRPCHNKPEKNSARLAVRLRSGGSLLALQGTEEVAGALRGGQRGGARPDVAGVAAAPRQLVAAALVDPLPGLPLPEALG